MAHKLGAAPQHPVLEREHSSLWERLVDAIQYRWRSRTWARMGGRRGNAIFLCLEKAVRGATLGRCPSSWGFSFLRRGLIKVNLLAKATSGCEKQSPGTVGLFLVLGGAQKGFLSLHCPVDRRSWGLCLFF